jgi:hypothetical protein
VIQVSAPVMIVRHPGTLRPDLRHDDERRNSGPA